MPYASEFTSEGRGLLFTGSGVVTAQDILAAKKSLDPERLKNIAWAICDLRETTELNVTSDEVRRIANMDKDLARITPGAFVALALAVRQLVQFGTVRAMPLRDYVAAASVGIVGGVPMLDLAYDEDSQADVDMNVVMTGSGKFIEVQATAEHVPFDDPQMAELIALAREGVASLVEIQRSLVQLR